MGSLFDEPVRERPDRQDVMVAYIDGGARGNPGPAGYGVYVQDENGRCIAELSEFLGVKTNNFAEYSGLLAALRFAIDHDFEDVRVISDSELLVKQMKGQYKVNSPDLRPLYDEAKRMVSKLNTFRVQHVLRSQNKEADRLANLAMDRGSKRGAGDAVRADAYARPPAHADGAASSATARAGRIEAKEYEGVVRDGVVEVYGADLPEGTRVKIRVLP